jgi:hypothetical protein
MKSNFIWVAVWVTFYIDFKYLFVSYPTIVHFFGNCICIRHHINVLLYYCNVFVLLLPTDKAVLVRPLLYLIYYMQTSSTYEVMSTVMDYLKENKMNE